MIFIFGLYWFFFLLSFRFNDEANAEMTDFIKKSVKGVAPDVSFEVLDGKNNDDLLRASHGLCMIKVYYNQEGIGQNETASGRGVSIFA